MSLHRPTDLPGETIPVPTTALAAIGVHTLRFDYATNPVSPNGQRGSHYAHARRIRDVRRISWAIARNARVPHFDRCQIGLTWYVNVDRRRDADNLLYTFKAMVDGLRDAGVITDDNDRIVTRHMPRIELVDRALYPQPFMELTIAPLDVAWTTDFRKDHSQ